MARSKLDSGQWCATSLTRALWEAQPEDKYEWKTATSKFCSIFFCSSNQILNFLEYFGEKKNTCKVWKKWHCGDRVYVFLLAFVLHRTDLQNYFLWKNFNENFLQILNGKLWPINKIQKDAFDLWAWIYYTFSHFCILDLQRSGINNDHEIK